MKHPHLNEFSRLFPQSVSGMKFLVEDDGWQHFKSANGVFDSLRDGIVTKMFDAFRIGRDTLIDQVFHKILEPARFLCLVKDVGACPPVANLPLTIATADLDQQWVISTRELLALRDTIIRELQDAR